MPRSAEAAPSRWVSVSDLAEYSYCPRAAWYRQHPPPGGPDPQSVRSLARGSRFHQQDLTRTVRTESSGGLGWALIAVAAAVLVVGAYLGGVR